MAPCPAAARLFFLLSIASCLLTLAHGISKSFYGFSYSDPLNMSDYSSIDFKALQVTRNVANRNITHTSGQITYSNPLQLWRQSLRYSASFNTSFLLNISPLSLDGGDDSSGGGMAFIVSSKYAYKNLPNSAGKYLGLFDSTFPTQWAETVAIEFDTFKDSFDLDSNHVGIDVNNSVESIIAESLGPQMSLTNTSQENGMNTSVWIDYDGHGFILDVYVANRGPVLGDKPETPLIAGYKIDLREYLPSSEFVYVGFSASLGSILETHCVLEWSFNWTEFPSEDHSTPLSKIIIGVVAAVILFGLLMIILIYFLCWRKRKVTRSLSSEVIDFGSVHLGPRKFTYKELKQATDGFSEKRKLGQGGFGPVYKGILQSGDGITEVAVKCLLQRSKQGGNQFKAEVMSLGRMRHRNLVQLLGWCYERGKAMLVYEYMPNGSLDKWINPGMERDADLMGWETRFHVMKGLAAGLQYLHEAYDKVVIHRDLKPSNVLLDADFNARISDFGLAKLLEMEEETLQTRTIAGTPGYIAPECVDEGIISKESDIFSLGVIAIELATGQRVYNRLLYSVVELVENSKAGEAADPRLPPADAGQMDLLLRVGLACCHRNPSDRPSIVDVVQILKGLGVAGFPVSDSKSNASATSFMRINSADYVAAGRLPLPDISTSCLSALELSSAR